MADIGRLIATMGVDMTRFRAGMRQAEMTMRRTGQKMKTMGRQMSTFITLPLALMGGAAIKTFADFESAMNQVKAVSGATGEQFEQLEEQARQLGSTTKFTAKEAAEGMNFLAMAGFEVDEIMSALPATLDLAAAGNMALGESADIVSNVMQGFGVEAARTGEVVDIMTKTFTSSNTNLQQLGDAMSYVAPIASGFNQSIEATSAAIGVLSDAGVQGTRAGTGLRRVLAQLGKKSDEIGVEIFDASGNMRNFADILEDIEEQGMTSAEAMDIFGLRGGPVMQILLDRGSKSLREFTGELENAGGTADRVAKTQMEGLKGAWTELRSALSELMISFVEPFGDMLEGLVDKVKGVTQWMGNLDDKTKTLIVKIGALAAAIGPLLLVIGSLVSGMGRLVGLAARLPALLSSIISPVGLVVAAIAALGAGIVYAWQNWDALKERITNISWWQNALISMVQFFYKYNPFSAFIDAYNMLLELLGMQTYKNPFREWAENLEGLKDKTVDYKHEFKSFGQSMKDALNDVMGSLDLFGKKMGQTFGGKKGGVDGGADGGADDSRSRQAPSFAPVSFPDDSDISQLQPLEIPEIDNKVYDDYIEKLQNVKTNIQGVMGITRQAFTGMANVIADSFNNSKSVLKGFADFFITFITGLIAKLIAAAIAAAILSVVIGALTGGVGGAASFGGIFKTLTGFGGGAGEGGGISAITKGLPNMPMPAGLATGGDVTQGGFFNVGERGPETAYLPAGTAVRPGVNNNMMAQQQERLVTRLTGEEIEVVLERHRKNKTT